MAYPDPSTINASLGLGEIANYTNNVTGQWFGYMILVSVWVIVLMGYYKAKEDFIGGLAVAGFGVFVVGLLFWLGGFVNGIAMMVTLAVAIISAIPLFTSGNNR